MAFLGVYLSACWLLAGAGLAKALRPRSTVLALQHSVGVSRFSWLISVVRLLAGLEATLGVAGAVYPVRAVSAAIAFSYLVFSAYVALIRVKGGPLATCGCFAEPDTPSTWFHALIDGGLATAAGAIAWRGIDDPIFGALSGGYGNGVPLVVASLLCAWLIYLVLSPLAQLGYGRRALREASSH